MDQSQSHLESSASFKVLLPILGMLGGLIVGAVRAWLAGATDLAEIGLVIAGGLVGSAIGMGAVLATAYPVRRTDISSLKGLLIIGLIAALVLWFVLGILRDLMMSGLS